LFIEKSIHQQLNDVTVGAEDFQPLRQPLQCQNICNLFGLAIILILISVNTAYPQVVPYIEGVAGEEDMEKSNADERLAEERLRLIGAFKLFNPDTVPFYLWVIFENGARFKHTKYADIPSVRLVDLELRYKNDQQQPIVKKFSDNGSEPRVKKRFGGSWLGGGRSGKRGSRGRGGAGYDGGSDEVEEITYRGGSRRYGAAEITFWKEDAQVYYEMELWGVLYAPDVREAVVAGRYAENINFEIELAK
jgi:hypothetical protein